MFEADYEMRDFDVAIIGIAGRFPKAESINEFWDNLVQGRECITHLKDVDEQENYINSYGALDSLGKFDASFFGFSDREATVLDPQQRLLFELTYEALEDAGYKATDDLTIGLFAGADEYYYVWERMMGTGHFEEQDYYTKRMFLGGALTSRVSYKLNLKGPSLTTRAACATSLVTVHTACQSLINYECDMALAGGVNIYPLQEGYYLAEGTISKDGHTRFLDKDASGFVPGNGGGIVVLKRLEDSIRDKDHIYAVIRGSAVNNDGNKKVSYSAPSLLGESNAIKTAQMVAGVAPSEVSYVEGHGTATDIGDGIEVEALKQVFLKDKDIQRDNSSCAVGSVKTNVGHLNIAAGVAGLIKTTLMLHHKQLVPSLNFNELNPKLQLENTPFYVNTESRDWKSDNKPRIAGVSSFGVGGTNAHIVLEEAPKYVQEDKQEKNLIVLSAKTTTALQAMIKQMADYIEENPEVPVEDIAYTLQTGRNEFSHRYFKACESREDLIDKLKQGMRKDVALEEEIAKEVIFMFPGSSSYQKGVGKALYKCNEAFRDAMDECFKYIDENLKLDTKQYVYEDGKLDEYTEQVIKMPIIFSCNYALAKMWMDLGVKPSAVMGYSLGEYTAACIAGVLSLKDALWLVIERSKLFQELEEGIMITVSLSEEEIKPLLVEGTCIAAINGEKRLMLSGLKADMEKLISNLEAHSIHYVKLPVNRSGHCKNVDKILPMYKEKLEQIKFGKLNIPMISTYTGKESSSEEIGTAEYWLSQMRGSVRFYNTIKATAKKETIFLEVGIGDQLSLLTRKCVAHDASKNVGTTLIIPKKPMPEEVVVLDAIGSVWAMGVQINWNKLYKNKPCKVSVPGYAFERNYYWETVSKSRPIDASISRNEKCVIIDGLSDERFELTETIAKEYNSNIVLVQEKNKQVDKGSFAITVTAQEEQQTINKLAEDFRKTCHIKTIKEYKGLKNKYEQLCLSCGAEYLKKFNLLCEVGEKTSIQEIFRQIQIIDDYKELLKCILRLLQTWGYIKIDQDEVEVLRSINEIKSINEELHSDEELYKTFGAFMELLVRCANSYEEVFAGRQLGKEVLYPNGEYKLLDECYRNVPETSNLDMYCDLAAAVVQYMAQHNNKKVRILEIGGGTGMLTWRVAKLIKDLDVEYYFTDIGTLFISNAQREAQKENYNFMKCYKADITKPLYEQEVPCNYFDIVISCNVIQATDDIKNSLLNMKQALVKDGIMCLVQTIELYDIKNMIFGLCPEWWNFTQDPMRGTTPALTLKEWHGFLDENGFGNIYTAPIVDSKDPSDVALIIGHNKEELDIESIYEDRKYIERLNELKKITNNIEVEYVEKYDSDETKRVINSLKNVEKVLAPRILEQKDIVESKKKVNFCRNDIDRKLVQVLKEVVGTEVEDLEQPIFELGIDSLSSLMLNSRIRYVFNVVFPIKELFKIESVKELSDFISNLISNKQQGKEVKEVKIEKQAKKKKNLKDLLEEL